MISRYLLCIILLPFCVYANDIDTAFSPSFATQNLVLKVISSAHNNLCMATYSFTSIAIAKALIKAHERGVNVIVVSDDKANRSHNSVVPYLNSHGIAIRVNNNYAIMHNKFIVADNHIIETGSFNYTNAAVKRNAENVLVLWNNPAIANQYNSICHKLFNEANSIKNE
jgi:phosphatidylserine/phosphatidylglycerophosphate/cardiolipin synthase-like enzyme